MVHLWRDRFSECKTYTVSVIPGSSRKSVYVIQYDVYCIRVSEGAEFIKRVHSLLFYEPPVSHALSDKKPTSVWDYNDSKGDLNHVNKWSNILSSVIMIILRRNFEITEFYEQSIDRQQALKLKEDCLLDLKTRLIDQANMIQKRFEIETGKTA